MKISGTVRKMIMVMVAAALFIIVAGLVASIRFLVIIPIPFTLGVLLTTCLNVVKAVWLERVVERIIAMDDEAAAVSYVRVQYFMRFVLTAVVLVIAGLTPEYIISLWGAIAGIFTFHVGKYSLTFLSKADDKDMV